MWGFFSSRVQDNVKSLSLATLSVYQGDPGPLNVSSYCLEQVTWEFWSQGRGPWAEEQYCCLQQFN